MSQQAQDAIRAAKNLNFWGRFATMKFLKNRNVPTELFTLARVLQHAQAVGV